MRVSTSSCRTSCRRLKDKGQKARQDTAGGERRADAGARARHVRRHRRAPSASSGRCIRARVQALFKHYGDRVYALDHPTVGASPIANALTLVGGPAQGCADSPGHAFARRPRRRGAGACVAGGKAPLDTKTLALFRGRRLRAAPQRPARARQAGAGARAFRVERVGARRLPGARHAAGVEAARRLPVGAEVGPASWRASRSLPELRRLPARGRAPARRARASCPGSRR